MGICKGFFKEFFVTKCRICGKKYWVSTPKNAKVCPKCCDELVREMDENNINYNELIESRIYALDFINSYSVIDSVSSNALITVMILMGMSKNPVLFFLTDFTILILNCYLFLLEIKRY